MSKRATRALIRFRHSRKLKHFFHQISLPSLKVIEGLMTTKNLQNSLSISVQKRAKQKTCFQQIYKLRNNKPLWDFYLSLTSLKLLNQKLLPLITQSWIPWKRTIEIRWGQPQALFRKKSTKNLCNKFTKIVHMSKFPKLMQKFCRIQRV
jgi:hypothetical protein